MLSKHLEVHVYHQSHERPRDHLRVRVNGCEADDELLELGNVGYARNSIAKPLDVRQRLFQLVNCLKIILGFSKLSVGRNVGMFGWRSHHMSRHRRRIVRHHHPQEICDKRLHTTAKQWITCVTVSMLTVLGGEGAIIFMFSAGWKV